MTFPNVYPGGLGYALGDEVMTQDVLYLPGTVYYGDNSNPNASDSNAGTKETLPWATLDKALTTVAAGSVVVLGAEHDETVAADRTVSTARLSIIGAGSSGGDPTATLRFETHYLTFSGADFQLRNVAIVTHATEILPDSAIKVSGDRPLLSRVYVEADAGAVSAYPLAFTSAVSTARVRSLKGVSVAAATSAVPIGILKDQASVRTVVEGCELDAGESGFGDYAVNFDGSAGKQLYVENLTQLHGADVRIDPDCVGWVGVGSVSGQSGSIFT